MDPYRNRAKCSFTVTVQSRNSPHARPQFPSDQVLAVCPGLNGGKPILMYAWRVPQGCTVVRGSGSVLHAHWEHTLTTSQANDASSVPTDPRQQSQVPTRTPFVFSPLNGPRAPPVHRLNNERKYGKNAKRFRGRNPVRGDLASTYHEQASASSAATHFLQNFPFSALPPGTTMALAHAHVRGGSNTHAQAHAQAGIYNFG
ncbi:uncharacterized protein LOC125040931 isoform X1 [Penaeus chinensis]|uniref:uncharacterized protein LOC125040931 isoform X1 n=1 Tax=Penaeus chinensis TaxID=139456 RepID=UPI001FB7F2DA|nr:uncharacterized protein LOC125040931 isoform X1 [Penaeus chinensis]